MDAITEYIRRYRDDYTREAINQQLLDAGYSSVEIGAAWREVEGIHFSDPSDYGYQELPDARKARRFANSPRFWSIFLGYLLLSYLIPGLLVYLSITQQGLGQLSTIGLLLFIVLQAIAIILGLIYVDRDRPVGMGLLISVLTAVVLLPFFGAVALYGICTGMLRT